ncbi:MAG: hypothetical protein V4651_06445 [Bacteroidota bacterium]
MRIIAFLIEVIGWLKIVASPLVVGSFIGGMIYYIWRNETGLVSGVLIALTGLNTGIIWATNIWRKHGTMNFLSKTNATPDLDNLVRENKS